MDLTIAIYLQNQSKQISLEAYGDLLLLVMVKPISPFNPMQILMKVDFHFPKKSAVKRRSNGNKTLSMMANCAA